MAGLFVRRETLVVEFFLAAYTFCHGKKPEKVKEDEEVKETVHLVASAKMAQQQC